MSYDAARVRLFRSLVVRLWEKEGRHDLPWRKTHDPYRILVSEVMLQQTQVDRVIPKYRSFVRAFPTVRSLSRAPLAAVLREWSGLGYNRRAKYLHEAARAVCERHRGALPRDYTALRTLPGVGDYTARAVRVFAFNEPDVLVETNVRTAVISHFFPGKRTVRDSDVTHVAQAAARGQDPRTWHSALFDYGARLKKSGVRTNARSAHYVKQSVFKGSLREVRGGLLRALAQGKPHTIAALARTTSFAPERIREAVQGLAADGLIRAKGERWSIAH